MEGENSEVAFASPPYPIDPTFMPQPAPHPYGPTVYSTYPPPPLGRDDPPPAQGINIQVSSAESTGTN